MNIQSLLALVAATAFAAGFAACFLYYRWRQASWSARSQDGRRFSDSLLRRQALAFEQIGEAVVITDANRRVIDCNRKAEALFGISKAEFIGRDTWSFVDQDVDIEKFKAEAAACYAAGKPFQAVLWSRTARGRRLLEVVTIGLHDEDGQFLGRVAISRDITERDAEAAKRLQDEKMAAIGQLTGGIAHDFNNLLGVIGGSVELAKDSAGIDARAHKALDRALRAVQMAADHVTRLQMLAGRKQIAPQVGDLGAALEQLLPTVRQALGSDVAVSMDVGEGLWPAVFDRAQLSTIILGIVSNAADAMPNGGELRIAAQNSALEPGAVPAVPPGEYVDITFSDTGHGMTPDVAARAFEPFFSTKPTATGLGLTLVEDFVKQCGGFVAMDSVPGHGTTIRILLPRAEGDIRRETASAPPKSEACDKVILVVEDEPELRAVTVDQLRGFGYAVLEASNAAAALAVLRGAARVDLLFSDINLRSGMDGGQLAEEAERMRPGLKIILCTGYAAMAGGKPGAPSRTVLPKPLSSRALAQALQDAFNTGSNTEG